MCGRGGGGEGGPCPGTTGLAPPGRRDDSIPRRVTAGPGRPVMERERGREREGEREREREERGREGERGERNI